MERPEKSGKNIANSRRSVKGNSANSVTSLHASWEVKAILFESDSPPAP